MRILAPLPSRKQKQLPIRRKIRPSEEGRYALISEKPKASLLLQILLFLTLLIIVALERLLAVELCLRSSSLNSFPDLDTAIVAATDDVLHTQIDSYPLHKLIMFVQYLHMVLLLDVPHENTLVHASRHDVFTASSPTQVQHVLSMTHQTRLRRPTHDTLSPVDRQTVLALLPNRNALIV